MILNVAGTSYRRGRKKRLHVSRKSGITTSRGIVEMICGVFMSIMGKCRY